MILHELSFNINIYETRLENVSKQASGKLDCFRWMSFIKVYILKWQQAEDPFLSGDFSVQMNPPLDTFSMGFLHVTYQVILD